LHSLRLVHRDLSANNVMLTTPSGDGNKEITVQLVDFDLCAFLSEKGEVRGKQWEGTIGYMAPEVVDRTKITWTMMSDIFAVGGLMYYMLFRQSPCPDITRAHKNSKADWNYNELVSGIDDWLQRVKRRCAEKSESSSCPDLRDKICSNLREMSRQCEARTHAHAMASLAMTHLAKNDALADLCASPTASEQAYEPSFVPASRASSPRGPLSPSSRTPSKPEVVVRRKLASAAGVSLMRRTQTEPLPVPCRTPPQQPLDQGHPGTSVQARMWRLMGWCLERDAAERPQTVDAIFNCALIRPDVYGRQDGFLSPSTTGSRPFAWQRSGQENERRMSLTSGSIDSGARAASIGGGVKAVGCNVDEASGAGPGGNYAAKRPHTSINMLLRLM
jgi:serine/threonine protein kinase